ncbi:MAG: hypothetical protein ACI83P_001282 [Janthinobacterium sp.]|jgi:hypothetical protein
MNAPISVIGLRPMSASTHFQRAAWLGCSAALLLGFGTSHAGFRSTLMAPEP